MVCSRPVFKDRVSFVTMVHFCLRASPVELPNLEGERDDDQ